MPSFEIHENAGTVVLRATGELTQDHANIFRSHLLKLLQYGRSKSYTLNLTHTTAMDGSGIELIYILKRELSAVHASLTVEMPEHPEVKMFLARSGFLEMLS